MRRLPRALAFGIWCLVSACAVVEYGAGGFGGDGAASPAGGGGSSALGGLGGGGEGGVGAATSTTTDVGGSTVAAMGGAQPVLTDTGLVARYYLDETTAGQPDGAAALDAAADPLNLPITWDDVTPLAYDEIDGQRGLSCVAAGGNGRAAYLDIDGTKMHSALNGSPTGTLEIVVSVAAVHMSNSRLIHIGTDEESGRFSLSAGTVDTLNLFWRPSDIKLMDDVKVGFWPITFVPDERVVLHGVIDSTEPVEGDRVRLYRNGALMPGNTGAPVELGDVITLTTGQSFVLGNREVGGRSFGGTLFYAAVYQAALTSAEVANNAAALLASDDTPDEGR